MAELCCPLRPLELDGEAEGGRHEAGASAVQPPSLKFVYLPTKGWYW